MLAVIIHPHLYIGKRDTRYIMANLADACDSQSDQGDIRG